MQDCFFAYGTLKRYKASETLTNPRNDFFYANSKFIGKGYVIGKLYNLGSYPGFVPSENHGEKVYGEVFEINDSSILNYLDRYEEAWPLYPENAEYKRVLINAYIHDSCISCWVYVYNRETDGLQRLYSGVY